MIVGRAVVDERDPLRLHEPRELLVARPRPERVGRLVRHAKHVGDLLEVRHAALERRVLGGLVEPVREDGLAGGGVLFGEEALAGDVAQVAAGARECVSECAELDDEEGEREGTHPVSALLRLSWTPVDTRPSPEPNGLPSLGSFGYSSRRRAVLELVSLG